MERREEKIEGRRMRGEEEEEEEDEEEEDKEREGGGEGRRRRKRRRRWWEANARCVWVGTDRSRNDLTNANQDNLFVKLFLYIALSRYRNYTQKIFCVCNSYQEYLEHNI